MGQALAQVQSSLGLLIIFWAMQAAANLFFKYGANTPPQYWLCFVLGNVVGASSIFFMMAIYARMAPNLALALASGGAFLVVQIVLAVVFHTRLTPVQWGGLLMVAAGMALASLGGERG